jgi:N-acetylglucosaminyldiphosphoundecaprenol N-acetyl-beta-D-mannosaminyltransferase
MNQAQIQTIRRTKTGMAKHVRQQKLPLHNILGVGFNLVGYVTVFKKIEQCQEYAGNIYIKLANPHSVMLCRQDSLMKQALDGSDMTLPDGVGIILAAKLLGYPHKGRTTGPMLMLKLCDWGRLKEYRHFFYGGAQQVAEKLAEKLSSMFPGIEIAGTFCPPFRQLTELEDRAVVRYINAAKPDIVWVGLGAPKQEKWMAEHIGKIRAAAMIGVGAAFDFHSGNIKWAPLWIRKFGLEWAYRLLCEPKRLWRRNLDSFRFLAGIIVQRLQPF